MCGGSHVCSVYCVPAGPGSPEGDKAQVTMHARDTMSHFSTTWKVHHARPRHTSMPALRFHSAYRLPNAHACGSCSMASIRCVYICASQAKVSKEQVIATIDLLPEDEKGF